MTIAEYIEQKFQTFGIELSKADLLDILFNCGFDGENEISPTNHTPVTVAIVKFVPDLLLSPTSFKENKLSMDWADKEKNIKAWYSMKCKEYDIDDRLSDKAKVSFWQ